MTSKTRSALKIPRGIFAMLTLTLIAAGPALSAQHYTIIHEFTPARGNYATGHLAIDAAGNIYGTTRFGGITTGLCQNRACGLVYKLSKATGSWTETILHRFTDSSGDGADPQGGVMVDAAGNIYGTTATGGAHNQGTVFELSPNATGGYSYQVIYTLGNGSMDGTNPIGTLALDAAGNLYGTTADFDGAGNVFMLSPTSGGTWTETVLFGFKNGSDGGYPASGVTLDSSGNLYGTTGTGGMLTGPCKFYPGCGVVFKLSPAPGTWSETLPYTFPGNYNGKLPANAGVTFDAAGNLYGSTAQGGMTNCNCGEIFELSPDGTGGWTHSVLYTFKGTSADPNFDLALDTAGNLYGVTLSSSGTVFKLSPGSTGTWQKTVLHTFVGTTTNGPDGANPLGGVTFDSAGNLYGTTSAGGINGGGVLYEITP